MERCLPPAMPTKLRQHVHAASMVLAALSLLAGAVLLWSASSFMEYVGALLLWAIAATSFLAGRELNGRSAEADLRALIDRLRRRKPDEKETSVGN
jgi:hypothetical protein